MTTQEYRVEWAEVARRDLAGILTYILLDHRPETARKVFARLRDQAQNLRSLPLRGRLVPELARLQIRTYRELLIRPYRLIYRVQGDRVLVVAVFDGRRNLEDVLLDRLLGA